MNGRIEAVKEIIKKNINDARCGIFCSRNILGDFMEEIYNRDGVKVDICYENSYFEVFGLSEKEYVEVAKYYFESLKSLRRRA